MASKQFYLGWDKSEMAEHMVEHIEAFKDRSPDELAENWDRGDMAKELSWADIDADTDKEEEGEQ